MLHVTWSAACSLAFAQSTHVLLVLLSFGLLRFFPRCRLWHQVGQMLLGYLKQPSASASLLPLQEHVVSRLHSKLSPLTYVRWAVAVASLVGGGNNVAAGLAHLEATLPHVEKKGVAGAQRAPDQDDQAVLLLQIEILRRTLSTPGVDAAATADKLAGYWTRIEHYSGVMDARVYAAYYQAHYELAKLRGNPQEYYSSALLYLTYTPLADLSPRAQQSLASDIGLAALLGANIYNFGELLQHPILASLDGTEYNWLPALLRAFNNGSIQDFNRIYGEVKGKYVRNTHGANEHAQKYCSKQRWAALFDGATLRSRIV
jgi:26S proteasome regulatory subunit N9